MTTEKFEPLMDICFEVGKELKLKIVFPMSQWGTKAYMHLPTHKQIDIFYDIAEPIERLI